MSHFFCVHTQPVTTSSNELNKVLFPIQVLYSLAYILCRVFYLLRKSMRSFILVNLDIFECFTMGKQCYCCSTNVLTSNGNFINESDKAYYIKLLHWLIYIKFSPRMAVDFSGILAVVMNIQTIKEKQTCLCKS